MARLLDLPNELLDRVASYLSNNEMHPLALTSRRMADVVRNVTYEEIHITEENGNTASIRGTQIILLARTLSANPNLAQRVKTLHVEALTSIRGPHPLNIFGPDYRNVILNLCRRLHLDPTTTNEWLAHDLLDMYSPAWTGIVLYMLVNLKELSICFSNGIGSFHDIFGDDIAPNQVPGLQRVENLRVEACPEVSWLWFCLPSLKTMDFEPLVCISQADIRNMTTLPPSKLSKICINSKPWIIQPRSIRRGGHLQREVFRPETLPDFRCLEIFLDNPCYDASRPKSYPIITPRNQGSAAVLQFQLERIAPEIEEMSLFVCEETSRSLATHAYVDSFTTLVMFRNLKSLVIPQNMLLPRQFTTMIRRQQYPSVDRILPESLTAICIYYPTFEIKRWLRKLLDCVKVGSFRCLRWVTFKIVKGFGADYCEFEDFVTDELESLQGYGIRTKCMGDCACLYRGVRDKEDKATFVDDIVSYLECLHEPGDQTVAGFTQFWDMTQATVAHLQSFRFSQFQLQWLADKSQLMSSLAARCQRTKKFENNSEEQLLTETAAHYGLIAEPERQLAPEAEVEVGAEAEV